MADEYYYGATEMESGPSFKFSHNDLIIYYTKDKNFRKLINTGQYIYIIMAIWS